MPPIAPQAGDIATAIQELMDAITDMIAGIPVNPGDTGPIPQASRNLTSAGNATGSGNVAQMATEMQKLVASINNLAKIEETMLKAADGSIFTGGLHQGAAQAHMASDRNLQKAISLHAERPSAATDAALEDAHRNHEKTAAALAKSREVPPLPPAPPNPLIERLHNLLHHPSVQRMADRHGNGAGQHMLGAAQNIFQHATGNGRMGAMARGIMGKLPAGVQSGAMKTLGLLGKFGPEIGAVIAVFQGLVEAAEQVTKAMKEVSDARLLSGGNNQEANSLVTMGRGLGMSGAEIGQQALQMGNRVATDPYAMAFAAQAGVYDFDNPFASKKDKAGNLQKLHDQITYSSNDQQAEMLARTYGLTGMLQDRMLSSGNGTYADMSSMGMRKSQGIAENYINDEGSQKDGADFMESLKQFGASIQDLFTSVIQPILPLLTDALHVLTAIIEGIAVVLKGLFNGILNVTNWVSDTFHLGLSSRSSGEDRTSMTDKMRTAAIDQNTEELNNLSRVIGKKSANLGQFGSGAMPGKYEGLQLGRQIATNSFNLGAFSLGQ